MSSAIKNRIKRFSPLQRIFHLLLMLSFLTQGATGLSRMYIETSWGKWLSLLFGGYESALKVHKFVGIFMVCGFLIHILYLLFKIDWTNFPGSLLGPDSLLSQLKDVKEFFQHIGWFIGAKKAPAFDRWGYWEKFDYWAVFWGMVILGSSGLLMAYSLASTRFIPGWGLNVALWVHRIEALLAMVHVFIIHLFIAHLRRHNFPMDLTIFEGSTDLEAVRHEKPVWIERLKKAGKFESIMVPEAQVGWRVLFYMVGYTAVAIGVFLLIGGLVNSPYITW